MSSECQGTYDMIGGFSGGFEGDTWEIVKIRAQDVSSLLFCVSVCLGGFSDESGDSDNR